MRFVLALALLSSTAFAGTPIDLDGGERAQLDEHGTLTIAGKRPAKLAIGKSGKIAAARFRTTTMVVIDAGTEAIVAAADDGKPWRIAGRFPIGGVGLDADYALAIDATPSGLVRYQTIAGAKRCDGKPAYLFAELFDPVSGKLSRVVPPSGIDANAPVLAAKLDRDPAAAPLVFRARIASAQGASDAGGLTIPKDLDDGNPATVWSEGVGGNGRGHIVTFEARAGTPATQLRIVPGGAKTNRARRLGIATANGSWWVDVPDPIATKEAANTAYTIDLPSPAASCVTVVFDATYAGATDATAFAELEIFAEGERAAGGGEALLARVIADGSDGALGAAATLAQRGASGVAALVAELAKASDQKVKRRIVMALAQNHDPSAAAPLATAATEGSLRDADLHDVIEALGSFGQASSLATLAKQGRLSGELRALAASKIDANKPDGLTALVEIAGLEPRELRRAVIDALSRAPIAKLLEAAATTEGASPDILRALTKQTRLSKDLAARKQIVSALVAGLPAATDYEHRYRVIDAIATLGDPAALATLETMLRALPWTTESSALRQVAVRAVAQNPRTDAMPLVIGLATDRDPGVRLAAIGVLSTADHDPDAIDRLIALAVSTDRWPEVRRRAAESLGNRCTRSGPAAALATALGGDRDFGVRRGALTALVQCHAAGITELLARMWDDGKTPLSLRTAAVDEAVVLGEPSLGVKLAGKLAGWRGASIESKEALELAQHAAVAIGRLNPPGAAQVLMDALDDSAYPEIVTAAALGLGAMGEACPAAAKKKLLGIASEDENLATAAKHAAAQCGK